MVNHRDHAKFDRAAWKLKALVAIWMSQTSLLLILIGTASYLLANAISQSDEVRGTAVAWECLNIALGGLSILLTGFEIMKTATEALTPKMLLISNLIKFGGLILCMIMTGLVTGTSLDDWASGTFAIDSLLIISILIPGSYAAWKWKRLAQYDDYHHPGNVKPFGFNSDMKQKAAAHNRNLSDDMDWDVEMMGNTVEISSPGVMAPSPGEPSPDDTTRPRGSSFTKIAGRMNYSATADVDAVNANNNRSRANSASALMNLDTSYDPAVSQTTQPELAVPKRPASYISVTGTGHNRRASYNHTRDTAFDEYLATRKHQRRQSGQRLSSGSNGSHASSVGSAGSRSSLPGNSSGTAASAAAAYRLSLNLKSDVDDALSAEFGWGLASRSSSQDSVMVQGQPPAIAVAGGAMQNKKSVRESLGRAPSDGSERGALGAVPEDDSDEEGEDSPDRRRRNVDEASRSLLGGQEQGDHPETLRPGRRPQSGIEFVVTPPPKSPGLEPRKSWGAAYTSA